MQFNLKSTFSPSLCRSARPYRCGISTLSQTGPTLAIAATFLCGLAVSGLSSYSTAQAQTPTSEATMDHPGWVHVPGELIRPDCVHEIPNGATVEIGDDGQISGDVTLNGVLIAHYDPCPEKAVITRPRVSTKNLANPPAISIGNRGWAEASWDVDVPLSASDNIDYMAGNWRVPVRPLDSENYVGLIYLFNGIAPSSGNGILQPVLQYGQVHLDSGDFGGDWWQIASWLVVTDNNSYHSPAVKVHPGDSIFGYTRMTAVSGSTQHWKVEAADLSTGISAYITVTSTGLHWTEAFAGVLEAYDLSSCKDFPASGGAVFTSLVEHGFPSHEVISPRWSGEVFSSFEGPKCGFDVHVAGSVSTLYWNPDL